MRRAFFLSILAFGVAHAETPPAPGSSEESGPTAYPLLAGHGDHASIGVVVRDALERGDEEGARNALADLAGMVAAEGVPSNLRVYVFGLLDSAREVRRAESRVDVGRALGDTAAWCGRCHRAAEVPAQPAELPSGHGALARAAWDALVWPGSQTWASVVSIVESARALDPALTQPPPLQTEGAPTKPETALIGPLHNLTIDRYRRESVWDRVEVLGRTLGTCAGCHTPEARERPLVEPAP